MATPHPKPIQLKAIAGTNRKDRDTKAKPAVDIPSLTAPPDPPKWMSKKARPEWDRLAKLLVANKLLPETSISFLAHTCELHAMMVNAWKTKTPPTASMLAQYRAFASDFGLTPGMMGRVKPMGGPEKKNDFDDLD